MTAGKGAPDKDVKAARLQGEERWEAEAARLQEDTREQEAVWGQGGELVANACECGQADL